MLHRACLLALIPLSLLPLPPASSAPPAPPEPETYRVEIRYRIDAFRTERLRQYEEMTNYFKAVGFRRDPDDITETEADDPAHTRMKGTIPSKEVPRLLRQRHVRTLLLVPEKAKLPDKGPLVRADILLTSALGADKQRDLHRQTVEVLSSLGFREGVGYDHRGYTRVLGAIPVERLQTLLEDLRKVPAASKQGLPFSGLSPLRVVAARPDLPLPAPRPTPPLVPPELAKFSPDLRDLLADDARAAVPARLEVILDHTPPQDGSPLANIRGLQGTNYVVEGLLGNLATVRGVPKEIAPQLAKRPDVLGVRLPRTALPSRPAGLEDLPEDWKPLEASGVARLHALGKRGKGTRLTVIAGDFRGWETLKGRSEGRVRFPDPVLLDLTAERNFDMAPDPMPPGDRKSPLGPGTLVARALLRAAPEAELTLLRIDPSAPYMLQTAARAINGEPYRTISIEQRVREIESEREALDARKEQLIEERKAVLDDPREDEGPRKRREAYLKKQVQFDKDEQAHLLKVRRYLSLLRQVRGLKGVRVVANSLVWVDGYPVDGGSALSRYFDDRPFRAALWFQAAGDTRGEAWSGTFRDADRNGVLDFAPLDARLPAGLWSPELNFLGWQPRTGAATRDLPAGARLRLTLQWKEAHDPIPLRAGEDPYRAPLSRFRVVLVYQPDPQGKMRPADDLEVVAYGGPATRLTQTLSAATYEQILELRVPRAGRYAVRVEGELPRSIFAPGEAVLPINRKAGEVTPRLFVHTLEGDGRAVWFDFATAMGSLGMPADAHAVVTVGAAGPAGRPEDFSAPGPPHALALLAKPEVLAYDDGQGTGLAAGFAAGVVAAAHTAGAPLSTWRESLRVKPGEVLRIPATWPSAKQASERGPCLSR